MRSSPLPLALWLCLTLLPTGALAGEPWVYLGDLQFPKTGQTGRLTLNLGSLHRRGHHYEVWEHLVLESREPRQAGATENEGGTERFTLWAIRCGQGAMAKVTERVAGAFEPRADPLRFYIPAPTSSGAAVIETACAEVRRAKSEEKALRGNAGDAVPPLAGKALELPPPITDDDEFDDD